MTKKGKKVSVGSRTYESPMSEIKTSGNSGGRGYLSVEGMDMTKTPSKGKKASRKAAKRGRAY